MTSKQQEEAARASADDDAEMPVDVPWHRQLLAIKNTLIIIITPIVFLPLVIAYPTPVGCCSCCNTARLSRRGACVS